MKNNIGVYVHIPFCESKCYYCDFVSYCNKKNDLIEKYIDALCLEILKNSEILSEYNINTVYFGGGTPSFIDSKYIKKIMETLKLFSKGNENEFEEVTIEINPNSISKEKLIEYKDCGINRISVGLQSTNDKILKSIGRVHTYSDFLNAMDNISNVGFKNVSIDLIYPLPYLNLKLFENTLNEVEKLDKKYDLKHISIYNLEIHENTKLEFLLKENFLSLCDEEEEYKMKEVLNEKLLEMEFDKYEISNYAKKGFKSKHNISYWNQDIYLGFGVNSSSFFGGSRYKNTSDLNYYIDAIFNNKNIVVEKDDLDKLDLMKEYVILKLRLKDGVNFEEFYKRFNVKLFDIFKDEFDYLIKNNLIINNENKLYLSRRGSEVANIVWEKFI